ncbi:MAG: adenine phosphoribosyltransferase, partial [Actinomycetota bacterium]|nr:adenine phosphoribosyltransferase [Actinomycetota bacterium]
MHIVANPPTEMDPGGRAPSSGASPRVASAASSAISAAVGSALSANSSSDPSAAAADASIRVAAMVRDVHDYPTPGIVFKDITPLLADAHLFAAVVAALADPFRGVVDVVAGIEARGFILGAPVALALGAGFVPLRKAGKLPRQTLRESYDLEYDSATLEMHEDAVHPGQRVLLVD